MVHNSRNEIVILHQQGIPSNKTVRDNIYTAKWEFFKCLYDFCSKMYPAPWITHSQI